MIYKFKKQKFKKKRNKKILIFVKFHLLNMIEIQIMNKISKIMMILEIFLIKKIYLLKNNLIINKK